MMLMDLMTASCSVSHHREMCSDCDAIVVLEQAVQSVTLSGGDSTPPTPHQWSTTVTSEAVLGTSQIVDYLCTQKFTMMDLKEVLPNDPRPDDFDDMSRDVSSHLKRLLLMEVDKDGHISPSKVAQCHVCAPVNGCYPVSQAHRLFHTACEHGFGERLDYTTQNRRKITKFKKTP